MVLENMVFLLRQTLIGIRLRHIWQYDGPMPNAPWEKDQRPQIQQKEYAGEYLKNTPYATSENMEYSKQACVTLLGSN